MAAGTSLMQSSATPTFLRPAPLISADRPRRAENCSRLIFQLPASFFSLACADAMIALPSTTFSSRTITRANSRRSTIRKSTRRNRRFISLFPIAPMPPTHPKIATITLSLVNVAARSDPWTPGETARFREVILQRLEKFGLRELSARLVTQATFTPTDFARRDLSYHGSLYGWASHSLRTSLFRPSMKGPRHVYFVGGTTHPGGGIPLVLLSGKMAAARIQREVR